MNAQQAPFMDTFARSPVTFVSGNGCRLEDDTGKEYLDCLAGIGCVGAGHANDAIAAAISAQAAKLDLVGNLFFNEPAAELAQRLIETCRSERFGSVFLANSGAEANECAIKLARNRAYKRGEAQRQTVVCADGSFHGRTMLTLAATGQPAKWEGFDPLPPGFVHAPFNDLDAFAALVDDETAAILVEPVQGESGVYPATREFVAGLRALADDAGAALIFDEVQAGLGRCGDWWSFQTYGIEPDIFTSAKALGNGLPVGACMAAHDFDVFEPGDHGTTFGGGPIPAAAAVATLYELSAAIESVDAKGELLRSLLSDVAHVTEVRGLGLLVAAQLDTPSAADVFGAALERGLVVNPVRPDALRFMPPLVISPSEIHEAVRIFSDAVNEVIS